MNMWRYAIAFGFDGTAYHGWQIQPNGMSVQQKLQEALGLVLRKDILVVGAGRTDAGVHARKMTAHFDLDEEIACEQLAYRLNRVLPKDIAVYDVKQVDEDFHALTIIIYIYEKILFAAIIPTNYMLAPTSN